MKLYLRFSLAICIVSICILSGINGCKSSKNFGANAPKALYQDTLKQRIKEYSVLNIPVEVPLAQIERQINAKLNSPLYQDNSLEDNGGDNLMLTVNKRNPIKISPKNGAFLITAPVNIWAKAGWKFEKFGIELSKYEETNFDLDVIFNTKITIQPDWKIRTQTSSNGYNWVSKPFIKIGGFELPISAIIERIMDDQLPEIAKIIDDQVGKQIDLKSMVLPVWTSVQEPILVNQEYNTWLSISPQQLWTSQLSSRGNNARIVIGMQAITETFVGNKPIKKTNPTLPNLKLLPNVSEENFSIGLIAEVGFEQAKQLAMKQIGGQTYASDDGKYKINVENLEIYGQNEQLIVAATLKGSLNGTVYLRGKPVYDPATRSIGIKDLDYDLDTKNKLAKAANWLAHGKFLKMMQPYFTVSIAAQLDQARKQIEQSLKQNKVHKSLTINGKLDKLDLKDIYVTPTSVQTLILATGKLEALASDLD